MSDKPREGRCANGFDSEANCRMVGKPSELGAAVIFKTLNDYSDFIMNNPDHPAHDAVRNRLLKERREKDARSRSEIGSEAQQARSAVPGEVRPTA